MSVEIAARNLDRFFEEFNSGGHSPEKREFILLRLQAAIIQFELCATMLGLEKTEPTSFARKVALKELIHKIYEYKPVVTKTQINRISILADKRGLTGQRQKLEETYSAVKHKLKAIEKYKDLRNAATGHYDLDTVKQVSVIDSIDHDSVLDTITTFLVFNVAMLNILCDIGRNRE